MSTRQPQTARFLSPRYWPGWLGLGLMRTGAALPLTAQLWVGARLGDFMYALLPKRRHVAATNIRLCFPQLDEPARRRLVREGFRSAGRAAAETGFSWWGSEAAVARAYRIEGLERLEAARAAGHGVILLGGHYTTLEISGRFLRRHIDGLQPVYKKARNPLFNAVMVNSRKRLFDDLLINTDLRTIVRNLQRGKVCWYAPDQDFGPHRSVFAPFMGVQTATLTMTMRLAKLSGSPILPLYSERLDDGHYLLRIGPPLAGFPSGDDEADAARINAAIEEQVRRTPEQYLWLHRRFKTRPPGEPAVYNR